MKRIKPADGDSLAGKSALDLFPDLLVSRQKKKRPPRPKPPPPEKNWLDDDKVEGGAGRAPGQPIALVAIIDEEKRTRVATILAKMGFAVDTPLFAPLALRRLREVRYNLVVAGTDNALRDLHSHVCWLSPARRREIFYTIVGPEFHTLYDLEALVYSANLVVSDKDLHHLEEILHKGIEDYEKLFRPLLDILGSV
jgi:hypothetical protein